MPIAKRVLLVDDDAMLRASLAEQLTQEGDYTVAEAQIAPRRASWRADGSTNSSSWMSRFPTATGARCAANCATRA